MLRIEEIVGAMDDEFRYALDALSDERLAELAADKSALRRLRPVGVSHAEALEMIATIQARRTDKRRLEEEAARRKAARAAKRKATPRRKKAAPAPPEPPQPAPPPELPPAPAAALPAPPVPLQLPPPTATGPAIRLPPPSVEVPAIVLPPPEAEPAPSIAEELAPARPYDHRLVGAVLALAALAAVALLAL